MPFVKNLESKVCNALEPEVDALLKKGWKLLSAAEEALYREELKVKPELTSAAAQEAARIKAGLYTALNQVEKAASTTAKAVTPAKTNTTAPANVSGGTTNGK